MKKFLTVVGNRPQLVKLDTEFKSTLVYTGQHYDAMLKDAFFKGLKIKKPKYDLGETELGPIISKLTDVVKKEKPDYMIVYGDTRSTYAGAIVSVEQDIPLIHIEAGCRSGNDRMIEERVRKLVDSVAIIHFAISEEGAERLESQGHTNVYNVGATQIDSMYKNVFPTKKPKDAYQYCVATVHRDFNVDNKENLELIFEAFEESGETIELYLHPRTKKAIEKFKINVPSNVKLLDPVPYKEMINRLAFSKKCITDSGGLQLESYFLRIPCVTLRYDTEYHEAVNNGWNRLVGVNKERIVYSIKEKFRGNSDQYSYGGGDANKKIRLILENL